MTGPLNWKHALLSCTTALVLGVHCADADERPLVTPGGAAPPGTVIVLRGSGGLVIATPSPRVTIGGGGEVQIVIPGTPLKADALLDFDAVGLSELESLLLFDVGPSFQLTDDLEVKAAIGGGLYSNIGDTGFTLDPVLTARLNATWQAPNSDFGTFAEAVTSKNLANGQISGRLQFGVVWKIK